MIIGFDTSNYTTSIGGADINGVYNIRRLLEVKPGQRGLRQSDALFQHIKQLPGLFDTFREQADVSAVTAVGVSTRPRSVEGSYMPVFLAGEAFAAAVAGARDVPLYRFSHQDGHLMAGVYSVNRPALLEHPFLSVHLSGGTTEVLQSEWNGTGFQNQIIGKTLDISAGQLIDRVGVSLGLSFPCGRELDRLSCSAAAVVSLPVTVRNGSVNLSGAETKAQSMIGKESAADLAAGVFLCISKSLEKMISYAMKSTGLSEVLIAGGVASNSFLRSYLTEHLDATVLFADPALSTDNAVGIALCAKYRKEGFLGTENCNSITD